MSDLPAQAVVELNDNGINLKGDLIFSTVSTVLKEGVSYLENHPSKSITVNLSGVNKIDSSGIAMLNGWKRLCNEKNKSYQVQDAKPQAVSLISSNKMDKVLNLK